MCGEVNFQFFYYYYCFRHRLHSDVHIWAAWSTPLALQCASKFMGKRFVQLFLFIKVKNFVFAAGVLGLRLLLSVVLVLRFRLSPKKEQKIKRTHLQCFAAQRKTMKIKTISNSSQAAHWIEFVTLIPQMFWHKKLYKTSERFPGNRSRASSACDKKNSGKPQFKVWHHEGPLSPSFPGHSCRR